jgi:hypothetical protein
MKTIPEDGTGGGDDQMLRSLGYEPELRRRMSAFSNFAISLSIICILAGGITSFHVGLGGAVDALTLHQNGREVPARRLADATQPSLRFPSTAELRAYVGRFQLAPNVLFEITLRGETLFAKLTGQATLPVFGNAPDHFVYEVVPAALTFHRDATGHVTALTLHQNGRDQRAPRLPAASADPAKP